MRGTGLKARLFPPEKLYFKILSYFLYLVILVLITCCVQFVFSHRRDIGEFRKRIERNQRATANTLDFFAQSAFETSVNVLGNFYVSRHMKPYHGVPPEERLVLNSIPMVILNNRNIVDKLVDEIFLYDDTDTVFTANGISDFTTYFSSLYTYEGLPARFWAGILESGDSFRTMAPVLASHPFEGNSSTMVIPVVSTAFINGTNTVAVTNLRTDVLQAAIRDNLIYTTTGYVLYDGSGRVICSSSDAVRSAADLSAVGKAAGAERVRIGGKDHFASTVVSDYSRWRLRYFTPMSEFQSSLNGIIVYTVLTSISLTVIGLILAFRFTSALYDPLRGIRDALAENARRDPRAPASGADFFGDLRTDIDALSCRLADMEASMSSMNSSLFLHLLQSRSPGETDTLLVRFREHYSFHHPFFTCIAVRFRLPDPYAGDPAESEGEDFRRYCKLLIQEKLSALFAAYTLETSVGCFIAVLNMPRREDPGVLETPLRQLLESFRHRNGRIKVHAGIGRVTENIREIVDSFDDAMTAAVWPERHDGADVVRADSLGIARNFQYPLEEETGIVNLLKSGDGKGVSEAVRRIVDGNADQPVSWIGMHRLITALHYTGQRVLAAEDDAGYDGPGLTSGLDEQVDILLDFFHRLIDRMMPLRDGESLIVAAIRRYIDGHFTENIYLQTIADKTNYSPKYISHLFKAHTGFNLSDYINMMRVMRAKDLVLHSNMSVGDIQNSVGLPSRTTFIRLFKKYEGTTPTRLREIGLLSGLK